jgi:hypothetical protein
MTQATVISGPMPLVHNLRMKRGADWRMRIYVKEDDRITIRVTTNWTAVMNIKSAGNGEIYTSLGIVTTGTGIINTGASGLFTFQILAAAMDALDFSHAIYEIILTDVSGLKTCPFIGEVEMLP